MALDIPPEPLLTRGIRIERWQIDVLDKQSQKQGELLGVEGGEVKHSIHDRIRGGGTLEYTGDPVEWDQILLRVWYVLEDPDSGEEFGWPLLTALPASQPEQFVDGGRTTSLELYDKLIILDQDLVPSSWGIDKGAHVLDAVRDLIEGSADYDMTLVADDSSEVQRSARLFEPATPRLTIINELLDSIGFMALWCDGRGNYRATRTVAAANRPVSWWFADDLDGIYSPEFVREQDAFEVPNRVIGVAEGDGDDEGLISVAEDTDPASEWSRVNRGRWVTHVLEDTDAASQQVLDGKVQRALQSGQSAEAKLEVEHDVLPLELNSIVEFENAVHDVHVRATLGSVTTSIDFAGGSVQNASFRGVKGGVS